MMSPFLRLTKISLMYVYANNIAYVYSKEHTEGIRVADFTEPRGNKRLALGVPLGVLK